MKILKALKGILSEILPLVFVPKCSGCGVVLPSNDIALCEKCANVYRLETKMPCKRCARAHKLCICRVEFMGTRIPLTHVTGYDIKRPSVSKAMILSIKDNCFEATLDFLANEMLTALKERYLRLFERTNVIISYVPRSEKARLRAGHDQSEQIAMRVARESGAPFMPLFVNNGKKKQKTLSRADRQANASQSYDLLAPELKLKGQTVVIIDDIVTTGSSIGACAHLAKKAGAKAVIALSAAKSEHNKGAEALENNDESEIENANGWN